MTKKPKGLKSGVALELELGTILPKTPAARMQIVYELMNVPLYDENDNPIFDKNGKQKTKRLITKAQARKLLRF